MIHIKLIIMALLWAGGFIAGKLISPLAGPFTITFLRFFTAAVMLAVFVRRKEQFPRFSVASFGYALSAAFLGIFLYSYFFLSGIRLIDAGRGSVIISTVPIVVAVISAAVLREKMSVVKAVGIITSVVGAWVVVSKGHWGIIFGDGIGRGELDIILCVFCAAGFTLFSRQVLKTLSPMVTTVYISALGSALSLPPALMEIQKTPVHVSVSFFVNLLYLAAGASVVAVIFYYEAIRTVGPSRASQYMNLIPVFGVVLAYVFLGEPLTGSLVAGSSLVTIGLYLANRQSLRKEVTNGNDYS